jgi:transposase/DNA-binding MarR family transcriptional regulator
MPFLSKRPKLRPTSENLAELERISNSRTAPSAQRDRAKMLLLYHSGETISAIAAQLSTNRPKVERTVNKALEIGVVESLRDLPGRGRRPEITPEAKAWLMSLACTKPKDLGYSQEIWTTRLLAKHVRAKCIEAGHASLKRLAPGTVSKMLSESGVKPHKIAYYLERRDPDFDAKMAQVLCVYKEVEAWKTTGQGEYFAALSYDEKPGIQAIGNTAPDLPPVLGKAQTWSRDHEYVRYGTLSLLAGIDLMTGEIVGIVRDRHRSAEFIEFLKAADAHYPIGTKIRLILDNHSAHISKETRAYLSTVPNRFEFTFTPKHGSWLNLIEVFFSKMTRAFLRGLRVSSKAELVRRLEGYLNEVNQSPVVFRWKYELEKV